jgi:hypothetical protein
MCITVVSLALMSTAAANTNTVSLGPFEPVVQVVPPGEEAPKSPQEGELLEPKTEVRTLEKAKADVLYNCEIDLPVGKGYVLEAADECVKETAEVKDGAEVSVPAGRAPGECEEPIAYVRQWWLGIQINGVTPPAFAEGKQQNLCAGDSVVAQEGLAEVVYPCTVVMEENSQLIVQDGKECALGLVVLTQTGAIGAPSVAAAVGGGIPTGALVVGGALVGSVIIGILDDDDGDQITPSQP